MLEFIVLFGLFHFMQIVCKICGCEYYDSKVSHELPTNLNMSTPNIPETVQMCSRWVTLFLLFGQGVGYLILTNSFF